jgi:hypothetical protein
MSKLTKQGMDPGSYNKITNVILYSDAGVSLFNKLNEQLYISRCPSNYLEQDWVSSLITVQLWPF